MHVMERNATMNAMSETEQSAYVSKMVSVVLTYLTLLQITVSITDVAALNAVTIVSLAT